MFRGRKKGLTVKFEECDNEPTDSEFYYEFNKHNQHSLWICLIFLMTSFVQLTLEIDDTVIDIASRREESCVYIALKVLPWRYNETVSIFYPILRLPCTMYDYNITELSNMTYNNAKKYVEKLKEPPIVHCSVPLAARNFSWEKHFIGTCRGAIYMKYIAGTRLLGLAIGSCLLGTVADLYGRKIAMYIAIGIFYSGTILQHRVNNFEVTNCFAVFKGIGRGGLANVLFVLFLEYCNKKNRALLVLYVKVLGPIGNIFGVHVKKYLFGFCPELGFIVGTPSLILIFYAWYVPESPRWCLSYCRKQDAWEFLNSLGTPTDELHILPNLKLNKFNVLKENLRIMFTNFKLIKTILLGIYLVSFLLAVEYSKKQYFTLRGVLRPYAHQGLLSMAKLFSFMYVLPPLIILRRRLALLWFFLLISIQLGINLVTDVTTHYTLNLLMMLCVYSVRNLFLLYMCEMFPTCMRATSLGFITCISVLLYIGYNLYDVHIHITSRYIQNIVLFISSLIGMVAVWFLPEVKHEELPDYKRYRQDYQEPERRES